MGVLCALSWYRLPEGEDCLWGASELSVQYIHSFKCEEARLIVPNLKGLPPCVRLCFSIHLIRVAHTLKCELAGSVAERVQIC